MKIRRSYDIDLEDVRYVSDGLQDKIGSWDPVTPVMIDAPTGSGKNTFILDELLPRQQNVFRTLVLTNRTALNLQFKRKLYERNGGPHISDDDLSVMEYFDDVWVISYQKILTYLDNPFHPINTGIKPFQYIIFDEAHFFLSDARFNPQTSAILRTLIWQYPLSKRIYMTATPVHVEATITKVECELFDRRIMANGPDYHEKLSQVWKRSDSKYGYVTLQTYRLKANYSKCKFHFFSSWDTIAQQIASSEQEEKWLIFVKTISEGDALEKALHKLKIAKKDITCIDASKKENATYKAIVRREKFDGRVLISTSVIDNGVNIKDDALKHVVIHSLDPVSTIQMAGRKRREPDDTVNFYFKTPTIQEIQQSIASTVLLKSFVKRVCDSQDHNYLLNRWGKISEAEQKLILLRPIVQTIDASNQLQQTIDLIARMKYSINNIDTDIENLNGDNEKDHWGHYREKLSQAEKNLLKIKAVVKHINWTVRLSPTVAYEVNDFANEKLRIDHGELEHIKEAIVADSEKGFPEIVLSWFDDVVQYDLSMNLDLSSTIEAQQISNLRLWLDELAKEKALDVSRISTIQDTLATYYNKILPDGKKMNTVNVSDTETKRIMAALNNALKELPLASMYSVVKLKKSVVEKLGVHRDTKMWAIKKATGES